MSGLPKHAARNPVDHCTGDWAGHTDDDDRHCVCWWDDRGPCCGCGAEAGEEPKPWPVDCIICGRRYDPSRDPVVTTLGVRCHDCFAGRPPTSRLAGWR